MQVRLSVSAGARSGSRPPAAGAEILLRDGSTAHVREARTDDTQALETFFGSLSRRSRALRFFTAGADLGSVSRLAATAATRGGFGLVATRGDDRVLAHAMYGTAGDGQAEVAFAVADELQGSGISTILLAHLAEHAEACGIQRFTAEVLPDNWRMLEVFRESGFPIDVRSLPGVIDVQLPTALSAEARARFEDRDRIAATAATRSILEPASVAIVGASHRPGRVGNAALKNVLATGFPGPVYAVNRSGGQVESLDAHRSVADIPGPVELVIVATPAPTVVDVARDCAAKGVRALVVLSAGFAETGEEGTARQHELIGVCRAAGMRLVGPNCLGVMNTMPGVRLNASFAPAFPPAGSIGFLSQSGALGLAIVDQAESLGLGVSSFVSNGNKADISGNDLVQYWDQDDTTRVIALYLESFGNPRKFARIARRVAARKPIVAVKSGRSTAGAKATSSHTGALVSASDVTVDALFQQAGVIRTDTLSELFDVARLLSSQPVPRGRRIGIVTNAGGLGILCADACESGGLEVPELPDDVRMRLGAFLPSTAATANPVDMIATATADDYRRAIHVLAESGAVDALVALFIPPLVTRPEEVAEALIDAADGIAGQLPLTVVFASHERPGPLAPGAAPMPVYAFPEDAAGALARAAQYGQWLARDHGVAPVFDDLHADRAAATIAETLGRGPGWLEPAEVASLLECYGLQVPAWRVTEPTDAAVRSAARELHGRVAIKAIAPGLLHKTDAGAVEKGITTRGAGAAAARIIASVEQAGYELEGFLVQSMAPAGVELLAGVVHDPVFGPVLACGSGGTGAELTGDVAVRVTPVTDRDATEMLESLRSYPLLTGYRGSAPVNLEAVREVVLRLGALVDAHPEIVEVDLNPVIASPGGAVVADARVRVDVAPPRQPWPALG